MPRRSRLAEAVSFALEEVGERGDCKVLQPFGDRINLSLAMTWISSLSELTDRMAALSSVRTRPS